MSEDEKSDVEPEVALGKTTADKTASLKTDQTGTDARGKLGRGRIGNLTTQGGFNCRDANNTVPKETHLEH